MQRAFHESDGSETGGDGHLASPLSTGDAGGVPAAIDAPLAPPAHDPGSLAARVGDGAASEPSDAS